MLVRMRVGLSGPTLLLNPGDEHDFPEAEAKRLIRDGAADPIAPELERAVTEPHRRGRGPDV